MVIPSATRTQTVAGPLDTPTYTPCAVGSEIQPLLAQIVHHIRYPALAGQLLGVHRMEILELTLTALIMTWYADAKLYDAMHPVQAVPQATTLSTTTTQATTTTNIRENN